MLTTSPTVRPAALASAAAAVLHGADPLTVSDIAADHPALAPAVRELAALTGEPVPSRYTLALPYDSIDSREVDISAADADDHYQWAREHGLADDDDRSDDYEETEVADLSEQGEPVEGAYPHDWAD